MASTMDKVDDVKCAHTVPRGGACRESATLSCARFGNQWVQGCPFLTRLLYDGTRPRTIFSPRAYASPRDHFTGSEKAKRVARYALLRLLPGARDRARVTSAHQRDLGRIGGRSHRLYGARQRTS